jgi:hypothetical protein
MFAIGDVEALLRDTGHAGWLTTCFARARGCTAVARDYMPRGMAIGGPYGHQEGRAFLPMAKAKGFAHFGDAYRSRMMKDKGPTARPSLLSATR